MAEALLHDKLNLETARIHWQELQPHFARGAAVYVDSHLDLIGIAKLMADYGVEKETLGIDGSTLEHLFVEGFKEKGIMALLGSGFDPGVTNVYTAWLHKHEFDEAIESLTEASEFWKEQGKPFWGLIGGPDGWDSGYPPMPAA